MGSGRRWAGVRFAGLVVAGLGAVTAPSAKVRAQQIATQREAAVNLPEAPAPRVTGGERSRASAPQDDDLSLKRTPQRLLVDEWGIVTSPARLRTRDLRWLLPLAGASAVAIATDSRAMRDTVSHNPGFNSANNTTSDALRGVFIGTPLVLFGVGELAGRAVPRDAGLLAGEAMVNAYATSAAIKYITLRERPGIQEARGHFFAGDAVSDPSFVSGHSIVAWSGAAVLAGEYSRPWQQAGIYGVASAVSVTRVLAQQHFPSDVLLGSVAGWLIGHYVLRVHQPGGSRGHAVPLFHRTHDTH